jgi:hypothetical protein
MKNQTLLISMLVDAEGGAHPEARELTLMH